MVTWQDIPTQEELDAIDWKAALAESKSRYCEFYMSALGERRRASLADGDTGSAKAFGFLEGITSMMLKADAPDDPFQPWFVMGGRRGLIPEDITGEHVERLRATLPGVDDPELKARIADLLWVKAREYDSLVVAVEAYIASANALATPEDWHASFERFERAANLAVASRNQDLRERVFAAIDEVISRAQERVITWLVLHLVEISLKYRGRGGPDYSDLCTQTARESEEQGFWREAREFWNLGAKYHAAFERQDEQNQALLNAAETWISEASNADSGLVRATFLQDALDAFRQTSWYAREARGGKDTRTQRST